MKQKCLLRDETDLFAQRLLRQRAQILAIDADAARRRIVEAQDERKNGALARAARADERVGFPGLDPQIQVGDGIGDSAGVAEATSSNSINPSQCRNSLASGASWTVGAESRIAKTSVVAWIDRCMRTCMLLRVLIGS